MLPWIVAYIACRILCGIAEKSKSSQANRVAKIKVGVVGECQ
jgi:hypothetical protein